MKKLPIGIQTFSKIIEGNYCYVDKTPLIARLADQGEFFFLSRPRCFGKSLLMDTLREAFLGNRALFKGLFLENNWDWSRHHPVIQIDFAQGVLSSLQQLETDIREMLRVNAALHDISIKRPETHLALSQLIKFKVNELTKPARALAQIKEKRYHERYAGKETWLIGIEFSKEDKNITRFEWEKI